MKSKQYLFSLLAILCLFMLYGFNYKSESTVDIVNIGSLPEGDTSSFSPNTKDGWTILSSYLNQDTPDSVDFELILVLSQTKGRMGGNEEKPIGKITNKKFLPVTNQKIIYYLLPENVWTVVINKDGQCYLSQKKGSGVSRSSLAGNPDVIPIKVMYKNN